MKDIDRYSVSGGEGARDGDRRGGGHDRPGWLTHLLRRQSLLRGSGSFWGPSGVFLESFGGGGTSERPSGGFLESFGVLLGVLFFWNPSGSFWGLLGVLGVVFFRESFGGLLGSF